ncbi:MAG: type II toxin-antitoxin system death-on-curing family toxin [Gemmatimonadota bacterium]
MEEPTWLDGLLLEALHADQLLQHGGGLGVRDEALLESVLRRPKQHWHDAPETDVAALAVEYAHALLKDHPFIDGNARTAFVALYTFLALNGFELHATEREIAVIMIGAVEGSVSEHELAGWIRAHLVPWTD